MDNQHNRGNRSGSTTGTASQQREIQQRQDQADQKKKQRSGGSQSGAGVRRRDYELLQAGTSHHIHTAPESVLFRTWFE